MPSNAVGSLGPYEGLIWRYGGRRDFWVRNLDSIKKFVDQRGVTPVDQVHLMTDDLVPVADIGAKTAAKTLAFKPRPFPGGLRTPHLHFAGEIYLLTDAQWKEFSVTVVKGLQEKLSRAGTVGFNQAMELSDAIDGLG